MLSPEAQVAFVEGCLREAGVDFDGVRWDPDVGPTVINWRGKGTDVLVGRAWELLAHANGVESYCCAACWGADRSDECHNGLCTQGAWPDEVSL